LPRSAGGFVLSGHDVTFTPSLDQIPKCRPFALVSLRWIVFGVAPLGLESAISHPLNLFPRRNGYLVSAYVAAVIWPPTNPPRNSTRVALSKAHSPEF